MNTSQLWNERFKNHVNMTSRYLRLMFNDHLAFALIFFVAAGAYFYQQWLETVPETFPVAWILAIILGLLLTYSSVRTFFKEADTVFLLSVENKLRPYIQKSVIYSLVMQSYWLAIFLFVFTPVYLKLYNDIQSSYLLVMLVLLIIVKLGNLLATWFLEKTRDQRLHYLDTTVRLVINILFVFFLVNQEFRFVMMAGAILGGVIFLNYFNIYKKFSLPWDVLIEKEEGKLQFFYRLANLSTDVPHLKRKPKKRHALVRLVTSPIKLKQNNTYLYLYSITFIRSRDYFGIYFRLILLATFFVFWIPNIWGKMIFALIFLFVTGFQFISIYNHHKMLDWIQLYPVVDELRKKAVHQIILLLMCLKVLIMFIMFYFATDIYYALMFAGVAVVFTVLFETFYVKVRIRKLV
ncbi:ABC transporter permease [Bacillaceae bacterium W0354]